MPVDGLFVKIFGSRGPWALAHWSTLEGLSLLLSANLRRWIKNLNKLAITSENHWLTFSNFLAFSPLPRNKSYVCRMSVHKCGRRIRSWTLRAQWDTRAKPSCPLYPLGPVPTRSSTHTSYIHLLIRHTANIRLISLHCWRNAQWAATEIELRIKFVQRVVAVN